MPRRYRVGLVRVVTLKDEETLNKHGKVLMEVFPELEIASKCIEDQPYGIYDKESEEIAKPKILRLIKQFESNGFEAVIVSCVADPAVEEARKIVKIPVIGAGSAVASLALAYNKRVGVLNLSGSTPEVIKRILGSHIVAETVPKGVRNTLDLLTNWGQKEAIEAIKELLSKGVDIIILGCTGYTTIEFGKRIKQLMGISIPILDPVIAAGVVTLNILKQIEWR
uniref:Hydantoin racemase n=1 Tax=Ignisphaera aggregans TaxID=334771 RepID=A0A7J2U2I0_9CREN